MTVREALTSLLSDRPHPASVRHVVDISTRMALAYLHQKARLGSLRPEHFGLSIKDLALDSTADLFQRDVQGRYVELRGYFDSVNWTALDDADLEIALRRIVFSKVGEAMFRRFRENDPNLAKVIRNIKDAARSSSSVRLERINRQLWLVTGSEKTLAREKPVAPIEIVETYVTAALSSNGQTQVAVSALEALFEANPHYRNAFPVSGLAKIVRSAFVRLGASLDEESQDSGYRAEEIAEAIDAATTAVRDQFYSTYVAKNKVDKQTFSAYLRTVRDVLASQYVHDTAALHSHFEVMAAHKPQLTEREYRQTHRNRIEYMVKSARQQVADYLTDGHVATGAAA